MKIFVSYTLSDGIITIDKLTFLKEFLSKKHNVFIHAVDSLKENVNQAEVIEKLKNSDITLLLFTEGCLNSAWVNLEVELSNLFDIPIITIDAMQLNMPC